MKTFPCLAAALLTALALSAQGEQTPYPGEESPPRTVLACTLADGSRVTLLGQPDGYDQETPLLNVDGQTRPAFQDMPDNITYVGRALYAKCLGDVLFFVYESASPYLKGAVVRRNPGSHQTETLIFAEKATPRWLYLGQDAMLAVIPNEGHESDKRYLVYRYPVPKDAEEPAASDALPPRDGYTVREIEPIQSEDE